MQEPLSIRPVSKPVEGSVRPPGSKSITNRALVVAALADGRSTLTGVLDSDDTRVMIESLRRLGLNIHQDFDAQTVVIDGCGDCIPRKEAQLFLQNSGTSIRFLTALCAVGDGRYRLDGNERMRERPIGDLARTLTALGAEVTCENKNDCPPVIVAGPPLPGGTAEVAGNISSQYLSALLMAAPAARGVVELDIKGELVSKPYVDMTLRVMESFGGGVMADGYEKFTIAPHAYQETNYDIEPDASAASYFFGAAAITGGRVTVEGLNRDALQGDVLFVDALKQMGCTVEESESSITVTGGSLHGIDIDMNAISDTAQTLAAVAVFADGPTTIRNIAHVRHKETDRIAAVAAELRKLGQIVEEFDDGLTITPRPITPATIATYDDHRMAMSFALIGLKADGVQIADPGCTAKTYPRYWDDLKTLTGN
ncbi:3-phosphoshikimate 1-carboxyvinyltransferase [Stratiformator vulcanicus]|uniref:3-phosphoshikimate 1-carboxyvinyltransferase n=1 Tax=Stratiformator vulcanicus TaxID=2527980 RepID=A0A517R7J0_9PLAN|nr:3-phosphoshikimate 1-carboxyvinyltransferase [Stratiformator vulcanicus]QDT39854.1 3-phosphoshikimate 1-carboxyvinyltransferase [Stratiformator vulcanicus]